MNPITKRNKIIDAIKLELHWHPRARLTDFYKNFFQDRFGPGHLLNDAGQAYNYLIKEIREAEQFDEPEFLPLGFRQQFYRINLKLLKEDLIPMDIFFPLFLESAQSVNPPETAEWITEWNSILEVIREITPMLYGFAEDEQTIAEALINGQITGHHSREYKEAYHTHYRLLDAFRTNFLKKRYL